MAQENGITVDELAKQLLAMQEALSLVQRDADDLNEVILGQQKDIDELRRETRRLEGRIDRSDHGDETREPADERPPHY